MPVLARRRGAVRPLLAALACGPALASAQNGGQSSGPPARAGALRPITQADYDRWAAVQGITLARDGRWVAYTLAPQVGDGPLVVRAVRGSTEYRVPRGFVGRPQLAVNVDSGFTAPPPVFSADGRVLAALTYAPRAEFDRARREKRKTPPAPSLAVVSLADGRVETVARVRSFVMPRDAGGWLAYLLESDDSAGQRAAAGRDSGARPTGAPPGGGAPAGSAAATPGGTPRPVSDSSGTSKREYGSTLVVRDLATGAETRVADVASYVVGDSARWLAYAVSSRTPGRDGVYARALGSTGGPGGEVALATGRGEYKALSLDRAARQLAFVSNRDDSLRAKPRWSLFRTRLDARAPETHAVVPAAAVERGLSVSDRGVSFVRDGSALVFGLSPAPVDSVPADSLADKAVLDLWHWQDPRLQPQQRLEAGRDRGRAYTAVYTPATGRSVRLGSDTLPQVTVSDDGRVALAVTNVPYAVAQTWGEGGSDVYVLDARTGARTAVARRVQFGAQLSPGARYVTWYAGAANGGWQAYDVAERRTVSLTGGARNLRFDEETWDTPSEAAPWGEAGWTAGERELLVYSRYDVWALDPSGRRAPRAVTDSLGARGHVVLRVLRPDREARYVDPRVPLLLSAFDDETKASGFYRGRVDGGAPERIVIADARFGPLIKSQGAEVYAVTRQTFAASPDVYVGDRLDALTRASDANPQQAQYAWGTAELVRWRNTDGVPLKGILYKPAGFDASRKYPMLVYFYEQLSDNLYQYVAPAGRNVINPTVYASNGYLVFFPDIAYTTGYPGQSALKAILPGVQAIAARGFVDEQHVGIAGQSWGGYQSAYIITQTPYFRAAFLGAPVANMTSAYGGIRWESGVARAFQYEKGQSRIGKSLWDALPRYVENSPLFYVDRVTTPALIMSNDGDGAVPWYQGIELFVGLRRFGKEAYLLDYNGDGHNPRKRANQLDVDRRMQQFFAYHLKGEPAPEWMTTGVPYLRKGREQPGTPVVAAEPGAGGRTIGAPGAAGSGTTPTVPTQPAPGAVAPAP
ncbi:peptidase S9 [Gemmatimonadetes bacterium T265]|nr:peptidase S9 [Gemmatimonadetes bacterium T265]